MANDLNNNGAARLAERILANARADAQAVQQQAEAEQQKVKELADHNVQQMQREAELQAQRAKEDVIERSRTNAQLQSRKAALTAKRALIQQAFDQAFASLCALQGEPRDGLLVQLAVNEAAGGETIAPAQADAEAIKRLLGEINGKLAGAGKAELVLGESVPGITGGFLLKSQGFEKNCSFEAVLRSVREDEETKVAQILFG